MENIQSLETEGSLSHNEDIPAAITDAMTVCSRLGIEFLWVDRLCIIQDDFQEKSRQINAMENIYGNCYITIAQLQGDGAHSGLCGVSRPRKALAGPSQAGDIYLIREYDQYETIKSHSKWVTRGWTFQEAFLSSRLLLFSEQGVIFECQDGEKINIEDRALRETEFMNIESQFDLSVPQRVIEEYTKRDLTLEADILFAFTGILHHQFGTEHYYGNCLSRFQHLLLWRSSEDKYTPRVPQGDMIFPSWSWISINGPIEFPYIGAENSAGNLALWMLVFNGSIRLIPYLEVTRDKESIRKRKLMKLIAIIAWRNGLLPSKLPSCFEPDANWQHYLDIIESRWSKSYDMYTEALGIDHHAITAPSVAEKFSQGMISLGQEPGRVLVYTSSLVLTVKPQSLKEGGAVFMTQNGRVLGTSEWSTKMKQGELNNFLETLEKHPTTQLDALALSLVEVSTSLDHVEEGLWRDSTGAPLQELPDPISFPGDYDYNHPSEYGSLTTILITVMLVETRCGISRRVGIGEFFLHDWVSSGPQLRPFVLA
ncbi:HET-domain-containing protein [Penicillium angulare]|uniref:HET-domain-containing protein n=1 Tax=Penicillium angulare TaxID=116970 RepID=A0A9W9FHS3_9EURO|nr:HET-domain-containing protein [Penicillium angulare]